MNKSVVVLGMHRSGTSLVSNLLRKLGVYMGENFLPPDEGNQNGYWEDTEWLGINKKILGLAKGDWDRPPSPKSILGQTRGVEALVKKAVVSRREYPIWGFKDPRSCLTAEVLHQYLPNPHYIIVKRKQDAVVQSLHRLRGKRTKGTWDELIDTYAKRVDLFISRQNPSRTCVLNYEDLVTISESFRSIYWIAGWLQIESPDLSDITSIIKYKTSYGR